MNIDPDFETSTPTKRSAAGGFPSPSLLDAGSGPDDCSGLRKAGRRHSLRYGLDDPEPFGLPAGLGRPG